MTWARPRHPAPLLILNESLCNSKCFLAHMHLWACIGATSYSTKALVFRTIPNPSFLSSYFALP